MVFGRDHRALDTGTAQVVRLGLALTCAAACAAIVLETALLVPDAASSPEPPRRELAAPPELAMAGNATAELADLILGHPLFTPGRRPPALAAPPPAAPPVVAVTPPPEWNWRLAGIMVGPGRREALFTRGADKKAVAEGQEIDGWTLATVRPDGVTLQGAAGEKTMAPQPQAAPNAGPRAAMAAAANFASELQRKKDAQRSQEFLVEQTKKMMASAPAARNRTGR